VARNAAGAAAELAQQRALADPGRPLQQQDAARRVVGGERGEKLELAAAAREGRAVTLGQGGGECCVPAL
jgi:hypothetical protein